MEYYQDPYQQMPPMGIPMGMSSSGDNFVKVESKDPGFLQWFLNSRDDIENLKFIWRGYELNNKGIWERTRWSEERRLMNEKGIHWATSVLMTYLNKGFQATNWNEEHMNYEMKKAYRSVWLGLAFYYADFEISKINTQVIANGMLAQVHAMFLSARADGIKGFLTKTQSVSEVRNMTPPQQTGIFSGLTGIFNKNRGQQQYG